MSSAVISISIIFVLCGFWIFVLARAFYRSVSGGKKQDDRHSGRLVTGKIITSDIKGGGKFTRVIMTVEFPNFNNSEVTERFMFKDSRPLENRYEQGKTVQLILDEDPKKGPSVRLSGAKTSGSNAAKLILFLLLTGALYGTYYIYQLIQQHIGGDWNNVDQLPVPEGFPAIGASFIFSVIMMLFVSKLILKLSGKSKPNDSNKLKLYGIVANAKINKVEETGVKINDKPMIRFHYEFEDQFGTLHKGNDKLVLGMIDLANVKDITEKKIVYEKENPSNSRLLDAMKTTMVQGCTKLISLFIALIFTVVLLSMFLSQLIDLQ